MPSKAEPLTDAALEAYEAKRDLAAELLQSVREVNAGKTEAVVSLAVDASQRSSASRPGWPNTSPMKRMFNCVPP